MRFSQRSSLLFLPALLTVASLFIAGAQTPNEKQDAVPSAAGAIVGNETPAQKLDRAWQMLTAAITDAKHSENRIQALAALSTLGTDTRSTKLIAAATKDSDMDVRTAAVLAAGKTKSPALIAPVRNLLDDPEPQVVFIAATTLWSEFKDRSAEDILAAVADGNRKATPGLMHGAGHTMSKTMHSPTALAKLGVEESAGLLLGPFGFSVGALEYMHKNGGAGARVQAIELLAQEKTPAVRQEMMDAITDNDPGVRAAAVKALGDSRMSSYATAVAPLMDDAKLPVRLTAAAAYIKCMGASGTGKRK